MRKQRIALIGAGGMANAVHYPSLVEFEDVDIVGLCDLVETKLRKTADHFHIEQRFTDYKYMIEMTTPEAVYVLMPPHHLWDIVLHCLTQKLHVFIEKPPGLTKEQTKQWALVAERNGCLTMCGFNRRFIPLMTECRRRVDTRGPMIQCVSSFYKYYTAGPYFGGAIDILTCDAIHAVDTLRWMGGGHVISVKSSVRSIDATYDNSFNAIVEFDSGCLGVLLTNWAVGARTHTFEMHGRGISAFINPDKGGTASIFTDGRTDDVEYLSADTHPDLHKQYGFYDESRHFVDCLHSKELPQTHFGDAVKTMELVDEIYRNAM